MVVIYARENYVIKERGLWVAVIIIKYANGWDSSQYFILRKVTLELTSVVVELWCQISSSNKLRLSWGSTAGWDS